MMLYTIVAKAENIEDTRAAYAEWRSDCAGMFTTEIHDANDVLVGYISSGLLDEDPTMVADGTDVYPNAQPMEVLDGLGYHIYIANADGADL
jgi:hypothetical protein